MRCAVFCFLVVCVSFSQYVEGLKKGTKGVCTTKTTTVKTRPKTVVVTLNKWCGKKRCTTKKTRQEKYTVENIRVMCCKGFVYNGGTESCDPVCSTGCLNGTCTDPDVCHCDPPAYLDPTTKNKCITPTCDHPCINSQCTINNTCTCLANFTQINATHCAPNCNVPRYQLNEELQCVPQCDNCVNGRCVAPNSCSCDPGYKFNGTCIPECDSCTNGLCVSPNTCRCLEGYVPDEKNNCVPKCDACDNGVGVCIAPGICECKEGYAKVNGTCEPTCKNNCVNGRCSAPDVCSCDEGLINKNATFCYLLTCEECRANGSCVLMKPEKRHRNVTELEYLPCKHGALCPTNVTKTQEYYVDVPTEVCCNGYEWDEVDGIEVCIPECRDGCDGGRCIAPDECACDKPLVLFEHRCIIPVCDKACTNGACTAPNICTCNAGYELQESTCVPRCTDCNHGDCTAPNTCVCHTGFVKNKGNCIPECDNCVNGICTAPNVCTCNVGYKMNDGICKPDCKNACVNASCVAPDVCECLDGYEPKEGHEKICKPKCPSCVHGECVSPNQCSCSRGYEAIDDDCSPICTDKCVNGYCSAPNKCTCNDGYMPMEMKPSTCSKPCSVCNAGTCNLDGECICEDDFELVNGTCLLLIPVEAAGVASSTTTGLAGLEMSWVVGGAVCLLLVVLVVVAIDRMWRRRKDFGPKAADAENLYTASVMYTQPNTLIREESRIQDDVDETTEDGTTVKLMPATNDV